MLNMKITIDAVSDLLKSMDDVLILAHENPDGDAVGSACALCRAMLKLGKNARVSIERVSNKLSYLLSDVPTGNFDYKYVVAVDTADNNILGVLNTSVTKNSKIDLCIDHHFSNVLYAEKTYLDEKAAGACEAIYDILKYMNIEIDKDIAECLYVGISTDTGCFRFGNTTSKTLRTAAALIDLGVNNADVNRLQFETKSKEYAKLEQMAISSMNTYFSGKCAVLPITYDMFIKSGADDSDTSALASLPRQIEGVLIGVTMKEKVKGTFRISVRTNPPADASAIAGMLGGGGHKLAAGCSFEGKLNDALKAVLKCAESELKEIGEL